MSKSNISKTLSETVVMNSVDHSLSGLPAINYVKGDRWIYVAFDKSIDSAGGLYEVNDSSIEACDGGDAHTFETFSEVAAYIKMCYYPISEEQLQEFKQMLIDMELFGPHLA